MVVTCLAGCGSEPYLFVQSDDLTITTPSSNAQVALPLLVRWHVKNIPASSYAVYIDATPMGPGQGIDDRAQDKSQLILTTAGQVILDKLPTKPGVDAAERNQHEIVVVALDASGRRIGEEAAYIDVQVDGS